MIFFIKAKLLKKLKYISLFIPKKEFIINITSPKPNNSDNDAISIKNIKINTRYFCSKSNNFKIDLRKTILEKIVQEFFFTYF